MKRYESLARTVQARLNCIKSGNSEWRDRHEEAIMEVMRDTAPRGSGIDNGTDIDLDASSGEKLVFTTSYHHMNDAGMYDGWTEHTVTVRASMQFGIDITVGGRNRNDIKEYLHDCFHYWLTKAIAEPATV